MKTTLCGFALESCIYNASGPLCTTEAELIDLANSESSAILTKSPTLESRIGNLGRRYYENDISSINSTGLANLGYKFYGEMADRLDKKKPYIVSVAGLTLQDNIQIITDLQNTAVDSIELNLSCPNIVGKSQVAYDPETMELYLRKIFDIKDDCTTTNSIHMLGIKLSPYFDHEQFVRCADIVTEFPVKYVTCINSIGYGLIVDTDTERTVISQMQDTVALEEK